MSTTDRSIVIDAIEVHCDTCGARPGDGCLTPTGTPARAHQDRRANAQVITRHTLWMINHPS